MDSILIIFIVIILLIIFCYFLNNSNFEYMDTNIRRNNASEFCAHLYQPNGAQCAGVTSTSPGGPLFGCYQVGISEEKPNGWATITQNNDDSPCGNNMCYQFAAPCNAPNLNFGSY